MDVNTLTEVLKLLTAGMKTTKGFSQAVAKSIVTFVLRWSGPQGWVASLLLSKVIYYGIIELKDLGQEWKDHHEIKKYKKAIEQKDEQKRKELEEEILTGK